MICGRLPYEIARVPIPEAARIVRESHPADPATIRPGVPKDVRTIIAKAMEKKRDRRYQSALGLAEDINGHVLFVGSLREVTVPFLGNLMN